MLRQKRGKDAKELNCPREEVHDILGTERVDADFTKQIHNISNGLHPSSGL